MPLYRSLNSAITFARALYDDFREFLSPSVCLCCQNDIDTKDLLLCSVCLERLKQANMGDGPICPFCGRPYGAGTPCKYCVQNQSIHLYYWGYYENELKDCILQFKFHNAVDLGCRLAELAVSCLGERIETNKYDIIIPVPLHKGREKERHYNQSEILAEIFAKGFNLPMETGIVERIKPTKQQAKLEEAERWGNVRDAFKIYPDKKETLADKRILIVDDIVTTGATIYEASRPFFECGIKRLDVMSLAYAK